MMMSRSESTPASLPSGPITNASCTWAMFSAWARTRSSACAALRSGESRRNSGFIMPPALSPSYVRRRSTSRAEGGSMPASSSADSSMGRSPSRSAASSACISSSTSAAFSGSSAWSSSRWSSGSTSSRAPAAASTGSSRKRTARSRRSRSSRISARSAGWISESAARERSRRTRGDPAESGCTCFQETSLSVLRYGARGFSRRTRPSTRACHPIRRTNPRNPTSTCATRSSPRARSRCRSLTRSTLASSVSTICRSSTSCARGISLDWSCSGRRASAPRLSRTARPSHPATSSHSTRFSSPPLRVRTRIAFTRGYAPAASASKSTSVPRRSPAGPCTGRPSRSERKRNVPSRGGWLAGAAGPVSLTRVGTAAR